MDRDAVLAAALGAAVLAACTPDREPDPTPTATPATPVPDPDVAVVTAWWTSERRLLDATPPAYVPLRAAHSSRIEALEERLAALGAPTPLPSPKPIADLARAERDAAARYVADLARLTDPDVAVLGAELAAGARQHDVVLGLLRP